MRQPGQVEVHVKHYNGRWHVWVRVPERWEPRGSFANRERALAVARCEAGRWKEEGRQAVVAER